MTAIPATHDAAQADREHERLPLDRLLQVIPSRSDLGPEHKKRLLQVLPGPGKVGLGHVRLR
jgi:hypothetical protein